MMGEIPRQGRWERALFHALALLLAACPGSKPPVETDAGRPACESRADCEVGMVCTADKVCDGCTSSGECLLKEQCNAETLRCELRAGWGTECVVNEDCPAGSWCRQGLCADRSEVSLCPGGTKAECPQGERCNTVNFVCEEDLGCAEDADCAAGEVCNTGSHACVPRCTVDTQAEICAAGEKCVNERCVQCETDAECGVGLVCDAAGRCSSPERCYQDRDCKVPLICHVQTGACLPKQPPCVSNENCGADQRCDVATGKCVPEGCQPDRYEQNDDPEHAFGINASRYDGLTLCAGDVDYFSISLARGDQLGVNVDADPFAEYAFSTVIKDATGRTLASGRLLVNYVAPASATYYVAISSTDPFQTYDVTFLLSRGTPCDDDSWEPNDQPGQATPVNSASSIDGAICPQDVDHFHVVVPSGKGLTASLVNYNSASGLLRLCVFDGSTELGCTDDPDAPVISVPAGTAGGKSLLTRVVGASDRIANSYTLKVEFP